MSLPGTTEREEGDSLDGKPMIYIQNPLAPFGARAGRKTVTRCRLMNYTAQLHWRRTFLQRLGVGNAMPFTAASPVADFLKCLLQQEQTEKMMFKRQTRNVRLIQFLNISVTLSPFLSVDTPQFHNSLQEGTEAYWLTLPVAQHGRLVSIITSPGPGPLCFDRQSSPSLSCLYGKHYAGSDPRQTLLMKKVILNP